MVDYFLSAKTCPVPASPPPGVIAILVQSGTRFGPVCAELSAPVHFSSDCPEISFEISERSNGQTTFQITVEKNSAERYFLAIELSGKPKAVSVSCNLPGYVDLGSLSF